MRTSRAASWRLLIATVATALATAGLTALAPAGHAAVPTTDDPPTYSRYPAVTDPGTSASTYFQPYWYDDSGRHIQAHGGAVVTATAAELGVQQGDVTQGQDDGGPIYYWYGEDRSNGYYDSPGVAVYTSRDTLNWTYAGDAMRTVSDKDQLTEPYFADLYGTVGTDGTTDTAKVDTLDYYLDVNQYAADGTTPKLDAVVERPKVLYNARTHQWVMWWHSDGSITAGGSNYARSLAAVAVSDSPTGPFKLVGAYRLYNRSNYQACISAAVPGQSRDMTVFQDADGSAYIVYSSEENRSLYVAKLDADYTNVEHTTTQDPTGVQYSASGQYPYIFADGTADAPVRGRDFQIVKECGSLEAPAVLAHGGRYYVIASGATSWAPNPQTYYTADHLLGGWIRGVEPDDPYENVSYSAIPEGGDGLLAVGDTRRSTFGSQTANVLALGGGNYAYLGDRWDAGEADSTYVWLPLTFGENGRLELHDPAVEDPARWGQGWDASYWADQGTGDGIWSVTDDHLPATVRRGADPATVLPRTVAVTVGGSTSDVAVSWGHPDFDALGVQTVTGTLAAGDGFGPGRTFTRQVRVWDYGLVNLAPQATVTASSRTDLAGTVVDGNTDAKGWDDWSSSGYPRDSWLSFAWEGAQRPETIAVHTFKDGSGATWPSTITVQYQDSSGAWVTSAVSATLAQDPGSAAPVVDLDVSALPATQAVRLRLQSAANTWQSISEVEIWGRQSGPVNLCGGGGTTVSDSFHQTTYSAMPAADACDGSTATAWSTWAPAGSGRDQATFTTEAATAYRVSQASFTNVEGTIAGVGIDYRSTDGTWRPTSAQRVVPAANGTQTTVGFDPVVATGLRLTFSTPGSYLKIPELDLPGIPAVAPASLQVGGAAQVQVGASTALSVQAAPADADSTVRWASSDDRVATVSPAGVVTGHQVGSAVITATAATDPGITGTITIEVRPQPAAGGDRPSPPGAASVTAKGKATAKPVARKHAKIVVTVASAGHVPTGTVAIYVKHRLVGTAVLTGGRATVRLTLLKKLPKRLRHKKRLRLQIRYLGDAATAASTSHAVIRLKR